MADDLRQRYAEALAEKFTEPIHHTDWVENPDPSGRVGDSLMVHLVVGGNHQFWSVTCMEAAEVCAAVRDEEMAALRARLAKAEKLISGVANMDTDSVEIAFDDLHVEAIELQQRAEQAEAERDRLRERAELAETAITNCIIGVKTKMNLSMQPPANPSEWDRGWWACVSSVLASFDAPYVDAALEMFKKGEWERSELITAMARALVARAEIGVEAVALVRELYDPTPCDHFDHHGDCQTHRGGNPCPDGLARAFLAALDEAQETRNPAECPSEHLRGPLRSPTGPRETTIAEAALDEPEAHHG